MRERRLWARLRGFTLLELLVVVCIIAILVTMVITTLGGARRRAKIAVARSNIQAIKAALAMYESDTGRYPVRQNRTLTAPTVYQNDIGFVWAALKNRPTQQLQGGPQSPYLEWKPEQIGIAPAGYDTDHTFGTNSSNYPTPIAPGTWVTELAAGDESWNTTAGQQAHLPMPIGTGTPYVFLDPWGSPYYYIEWASVPTATKDGLVAAPSSINSTPIVNTSGGTSSGTTEPHNLQPHDIAKFDIWSFGPNGVNEAGEGDDIASWTDTAKK